MTIRKVRRRGETRLVVDILYTKRDGTKGRYRHDAEVQTMAAARAEERRVLASIVLHGEPSSEIVAAQTIPSSEIVAAQTIGDRSPIRSPEGARSSVTFAEAVDVFRKGKALTKLKPTTRTGYYEILRTRLLPTFGSKPVTSIDFASVTALDAEMAEQRLSLARRRNVAVALRSVLGAAVDAGFLVEVPRLPKLPKSGRKVLRCMTTEQVQKVLSVSSRAARIAIGLAAYAGLRAGEVRALRWGDVDLDAGILVVRFSTTRRVTSTPKSGHEREIPIADPLRAILDEGTRGKGKALVALTREGMEWGEYGLRQVFKRACKRADVGMWRFHDLRHYFATELFRRGASAPAVQALAGHTHLATTQKYAHVAEADLRRTIGLFGRGNSAVTGSAALH